MIYWIWLSKLAGIGIHTQRLLLEYFDTPKEIYKAQKDELIKAHGIGERKAEQILNTKSLAVAEKIKNDCEKMGIKIMTRIDSIYPEAAKQVPDMPILLYYKGNPRINSMGTAIIGSRRCTREGKKAAVDYAEKMVKESTIVISGMAKGIDSYAHTACINEGGYTIAVLGHGLDICYPSEHKLLMKRIEEMGLLLSEYEPGVRPNKSHFPRRNKIIAAWSNQIVIVEAGRGSGALITADYGIKYGRTVKFIDEKGAT